MFLLWLTVFIVICLTGAFLLYRFSEDDDSFGFNFGLVIFVVSFFVIVIMTITIFSNQNDIKNKIIKIEVLRSQFTDTNLLSFEDTTVTSDRTFLLEKALEYNEQIIDWQSNNKWFKSGIKIPDEVDSLKLIE